MRSNPFLIICALSISSLISFESAYAQKANLKDTFVDPIYKPVEWKSYTGEKIGVAILSFEDGISVQAEANRFNADSGIQENFGLGDGLANMLVSTLHSTNRFKIVDKRISRRLFELYSNDTANKMYAGAPTLPRVGGLKYFIIGSLTAFDDGTKSVEGGIGIGGVKLSAGKSTASLTMHMRIIDATSGQVVYSAPVEGTASVSKAGIAIDGIGNLSGSLAAPIGQATQKMLDKATDQIIVKSFPGTPSIFPQ